MSGYVVVISPEQAAYAGVMDGDNFEGVRVCVVDRLPPIAPPASPSPNWVESPSAWWDGVLWRAGMAGL